jgi:hypothetical protein
VIPALPANQRLTPVGLVHVEPAPSGPLLYLDGDIIYPQGLDAINSLKPATNRPGYLHLAGAWPQDGPLADWVLVIADSVRAGPCSARLLILRVHDRSLSEAPFGLKGRDIALNQDGTDLILRGFCASGGPAADEPIGRLNAADGRWVWQGTRGKSDQEAETPAPAGAGWRQTNPSRLASPLGEKGALASIACRPDTGYTLAVSGLPAPSQGTKAKIEFGSGGRSTQLVMTWRDASRSYEAAGRARQATDDPVLFHLISQKPLEIRGLSGKITLPPPTNDQMTRLIARCGAPAMER